MTAVELRPGVGITVDGVPGGPVDVPFGLRAGEVVALLPAARPARMLHTAWARTVGLPGLAVSACGGESGRLEWFDVSALDDGFSTPVTLAGIELFDRPREEVEAQLIAEGHRVTSRPQLARVGSDLVLFRFTGPRFHALLFSARASTARPAT